MDEDDNDDDEEDDDDQGVRLGKNGSRMGSDRWAADYRVELKSMDDGASGSLIVWGCETVRAVTPLPSSG